jgi:hypothetical protein
MVSTGGPGVGTGTGTNSTLGGGGTTVGAAATTGGCWGCSSKQADEQETSDPSSNLLYAPAGVPVGKCVTVMTVPLVERPRVLTVHMFSIDTAGL